MALEHVLHVQCCETIVENYTFIIRRFRCKASKDSSCVISSQLDLWARAMLCECS